MPRVKDLLQLRRTFVLILFVGLFAMAARNVLDPDVWWHLKTGQWILQHHAVPRADPFSYTRAGKPWTAHEWLCELALYGLFRCTGYGGLIVVFAALISASFVPLYVRCGAGSVASAAVTAWGALATTAVWGVRPQILTMLLLSIWLWILERSGKKPNLLWWTLPLQLLWVNVHGGAILGPAFLGLFIVGEIVEKLLSPTDGIVSDRLKWLGMALLADLAILSLNPEGLALIWYPMQTMRVQGFISEWAPPNFHSADYRAFLLLILATFAVLAFSQRRVRYRDVLLLLASITAALSSVRMIPLFVLVAVPVVSRPLGDYWAARKTVIRSRRAQPAFLHAVVLLFMIGFAAIHTWQVIGSQQQAEAAHFPTGAVAYLRQHPPEGHIFNHYDWGGYLIFELQPQIPVFVDGRTEVYGESMMRDFMHTYYLQGDWRKPLSQWKVDTVLIPPSSALASALSESPDWAVSYQDSVAEVFSKSKHDPMR